MKKVLIAGILAAVATCTSFAQTYRSERVYIPFAFTVHGAGMPAGYYHVVCQSNNILFLTNDDTRHSVQFIRPNWKLSEHAKLYFQNKQGGLALSAFE